MTTLQLFSLSHYKLHSLLVQLAGLTELVLALNPNFPTMKGLCCLRLVCLDIQLMYMFYYYTVQNKLLFAFFAKSLLFYSSPLWCLAPARHTRYMISMKNLKLIGCPMVLGQPFAH